MFTIFTFHLLYFSLLCFILSQHYVFSTQDLDIETKLKDIRSTIDMNTTAFCYHAASGSINEYLHNGYSQFTNDLDVLIYPFCLRTHELGNSLGNYLMELSCAEASGLHFITIHPQWNLNGSLKFIPSEYNNGPINPLVFLNNLPSVLVNQKGFGKGEIRNALHHYCKCRRYCWSHLDHAWIKMNPSLQHHLAYAFDKFHESIPSTYMTTYNNESDLAYNILASDQLPLIPDVTIHYRCGDNIAFNYQYGILPFTVFDNRIPKDAKYIYILSEPISRAANNPYTYRCQTILEHLLTYLSNRFSTSKILIKRGGDIFVDYLRIHKSNTTICSASSFCFWPAMSSKNDVYFPLTSLIAGGDNITTVPHFRDKFHWISETNIISSFKGLRPWTKILDILANKTSRPDNI